MNIKEQYGAVILELKGKLVGGLLSERINQTLDNFINQGKKNIIIDLSRVTYLNSSGMGILISGFSKLKNSGGTLKLANVTNKIEGILSITKLNQIFENYATVEDAVKSFKD